MNNFNCYDFRSNEHLCKIVENIKKEIRPLQKSRIYDACKNYDDSFRRVVQCEPLNSEQHPFMTMSQLSEIKANDPGEQQIDYKAIEKSKQVGKKRIPRVLSDGYVITKRVMKYSRKRY